VGILTLELRLFACDSLKRKRSVIKRIINDLHDECFSAAEVGNQDSLSRATLACVRVGENWVYVERRLTRVLSKFDRHGEVELIDSYMERLI